MVQHDRMTPAIDPQGNTPRIVVWGTYDLGKPRVRILLKGLRENGVSFEECHANVWVGVEDKSQIRRFSGRIRFLSRWLSSYPRLVWRYLRLPPHDVVLVPYMGQLDVLVLLPLARMRRANICLDAFLSLYNTVVEDRALIKRGSLVARLLYAWEWLACRAADRLICDTNAHGDYFARTFGLPRERIGRVLVGVEPEIFGAARSTEDETRAAFKVLFYGQFIPLHGIETIVKAAKATENDDVEWSLIGKGQQENRIRELIEALSPMNITWENWVPYEKLTEKIADSDVCLGIFGLSDKAQRVIPNKVFQILAAQKPLITADTPGIRELLADEEAVILVRPSDDKALRDAVLEMRLRLNHARERGEVLKPSAKLIRPKEIGVTLVQQLTRLREDAKPMH